MCGQPNNFKFVYEESASAIDVNDEGKIVGLFWRNTGKSPTAATTGGLGVPGTRTPAQTALVAVPLT